MGQGLRETRAPSLRLPRRRCPCAPKCRLLRLTAAALLVSLPPFTQAAFLGVGSSVTVAYSGAAPLASEVLLARGRGLELEWDAGTPSPQVSKP